MMVDFTEKFFPLRVRRLVVVAAFLKLRRQEQMFNI